MSSNISNTIKFIKFTEKDSTKSVPHYEVNAFDKFNNHIGHYQIKGLWLENVYVNPSQRNKGYCKILVKHAMNRKKNLKLLVKKYNNIAINCYKKCGFKYIKDINNNLQLFQS